LVDSYEKNPTDARISFREKKQGRQVVGTPKEEALFCAAVMGNVRKVKELCADKTVNVNWASDSKITSLISACYAGQTEVVRELLKHPEIDINHQDSGGGTAFLNTCVPGHMEIAALLMAQPKIEINKADIHQLTPFFSACQHGRDQLVKVMLADPRVEVNPKSIYMVTPFYIACQQNQMRVITVLLGDPRVDPNFPKLDDVSPFSAACAFNHRDLVAMLVESPRIDPNKPNKNGDSPLLLSCVRGFAEVVAVLVNCPRVDLNQANDGDVTPIWVACQSGDFRIAKFLLSSGRLIDTELRREGYPPASEYARAIGTPSCVAVADLVEEYDRDPVALTIKLRKELGLPPLKPEVLRELKQQVERGLSASDPIWTTPETPFHANGSADRPLLPELPPGSPWGLDVDPDTWDRKEESYFYLRVKDDATRHEEAFVRFNSLADLLGFDAKVATKVYAVANAKLLTNFDKYRNMLREKQASSPGMFKKTDWLTMAKTPQRQRFVEWLSSFGGNFGWNDGGELPVVMLLHATSEETAWQICQEGFGQAAISPEGPYGKGVYFTSKMALAEQDKKGEKTAFLLSAVIPGNPFPVVEAPLSDNGSPNPSGFQGKGCRSGYQSHWLLLDRNTGLPAKGTIDPAAIADRLVTFGPSQAVPLFLFFTK